MTKVELIYFKESGKYYSEGSYESEHEFFYDIVDEIKIMLARGKRPGLVDGHEFNVLAEINVKYGPLPHLFVRKK